MASDRYWKQIWCAAVHLNPMSISRPRRPFLPTIAFLRIEERFDVAIDSALKRLWQLQLARRIGRKNLKLIDGKSPKQLEYCNSVAREKK
jgi:hypothetical protein